MLPYIRREMEAPDSRRSLTYMAVEKAADVILTAAEAEAEIAMRSNKIAYIY